MVENQASLGLNLTLPCSNEKQEKIINADYYKPASHVSQWLQSCEPWLRVMRAMGASQLQAKYMASHASQHASHTVIES